MRCRDIDPSELAKASKERAFFNVPQNKWLAIQVHPRRHSLVRGRETARPVVRSSKKHASQKPRGPPPSRFLRGAVLRPLLLFSPPRSGSSIAAQLVLERTAARDAHYRNCFTRRLGSMYICYRCGHRYGNCGRTFEI